MKYFVGFGGGFGGRPPLDGLTAADDVVVLACETLTNEYVKTKTCPNNKADTTPSPHEASLHYTPNIKRVLKTSGPDA